MAPEIDVRQLDVACASGNCEGAEDARVRLMEELEKWTKKSIIIQADPTLHWEQYDIY